MAAGHEVVCVYSQPARQKGRGQNLKPSPIDDYARRKGLMVRQPASLKEAVTQQDFAAMDADVAVVVAYGLLLPAPILTAPRYGCLNVHASLLPRWRGAAPIERALMAGDRQTGVTIMQMDTGLDTGAMLGQEKMAITPLMNAGDVHDSLAIMGARLITQILTMVEQRTVLPEKQPDFGITYAEKIQKKDGHIIWDQPVDAIDCLVRALSPKPGCWFMVGDQRIRVLAGEKVEDSKSIPAKHGVKGVGVVVASPLIIGCQDGFYQPKLLQRAGGKILPMAEFLNGFRIAEGTKLM